MYPGQTQIQVLRGNGMGACLLEIHACFDLGGFWSERLLIMTIEAHFRHLERYRAGNSV